MAHAFFLGVDTRSQTDSSNGESSPSATVALLEKEQAGENHPTYRLDSIRHEEGDIDPGDLADHIQSLVARSPYIGRTSIIVNRHSELGDSIVEALQSRGLDPTKAIFVDGTDGPVPKLDDADVHVSPYDALETIADLYRDGYFEFEQHASEDVSNLARGLQRMTEYFADVEEASAAPDASDGPPSRPASVDPQVTSAALAAWLGAERSFDPSQHLKEHPQTDAKNR